MFDKFSDCLNFFKENILNIIVNNNLFPLEIKNISSYELHRPLSAYEIKYYYSKNMELNRLLYHFLFNDNYPFNCFFISKYVLILFNNELNKKNSRTKNSVKYQDKIVENIIMDFKKKYDPLFINEAYFFKSCRNFQSKYNNIYVEKPSKKNKYEIKYKIFNGPEKTKVISHLILDELYFDEKIKKETFDNYKRDATILKIEKIEFNYKYNYFTDRNSAFRYSYQ